MMFLRLLYGAVLRLGLLICLQETTSSIQSEHRLLWVFLL